MTHAAVLTTVSNACADAVDTAGPSVVQIHGRRRPASGVVHSPGVVVTMARTLGREDGAQVRSGDGVLLDAEVAGWDPATGLAVLRAPGLSAPPMMPGASKVRVGHLAMAVARSWSNAVTASVGAVAIIGGPLATGRRRSIEQVIRTTAPMHDGFVGGALIDTDGRLIGVATAAAIRGLGVVIPTAIAWKTVETVLAHGTARRAYLGIAGQPAILPEAQRRGEARESALLVVAVTPASPAAQGGVLVGDLLLDIEGKALGSPEDLLECLTGDRIGRPLAVRVLRGTNDLSLTITPGERPER